MDKTSQYRQLQPEDGITMVSLWQRLFVARAMSKRDVGK